MPGNVGSLGAADLRWLNADGEFLKQSEVLLDDKYFGVKAR